MPLHYLTPRRCYCRYLLLAGIAAVLVTHTACQRAPISPSDSFNVATERVLEHLLGGSVVPVHGSSRDVRETDSVVAPYVGDLTFVAPEVRKVPDVGWILGDAKIAVDYEKLENGWRCTGATVTYANWQELVPFRDDGACAKLVQRLNDVPSEVVHFGVVEGRDDFLRRTFPSVNWANNPDDPSFKRLWQDLIWRCGGVTGYRFLRHDVHEHLFPNEVLTPALVEQLVKQDKSILRFDSSVFKVTPDLLRAVLQERERFIALKKKRDAVDLTADGIFPRVFSISLEGVSDRNGNPQMLTLDMASSLMTHDGHLALSNMSITTPDVAKALVNRRIKSPEMTLSLFKMGKIPDPVLSVLKSFGGKLEIAVDDAKVSEPSTARATE